MQYFQDEKNRRTLNFNSIHFNNMMYVLIDWTLHLIRSLICRTGRFRKAQVLHYR